MRSLPLCIFIDIIALLFNTQGVQYNLAGNNTIAIFPYNKTIFTDVSSCKSLCDNSLRCNGYSFDSSYCYFSQCDQYNKTTCCNECKFASKKTNTTPVSCFPWPVSSQTTMATAPLVTETSIVDCKNINNQSTTVTHPNFKTTVNPVSKMGNTSEATDLPNSTITDSEPNHTEVTQIYNNETDSQSHNTKLIVDNITTTGTEPTTRILVADNTTLDPEVTANITASKTFDKTTGTEPTTTVADNTTLDTEMTTNIAATETFEKTTSLFNDNVNDTTVTQIINSDEICVCVCKFTNQSVDDLTKDRQKELTVKKATLSTTVRKLTSAKDFRTSSKSIGAVSVVIMVFFGAFVLYPDIHSVWNFVFRKLSEKKKNSSIGHIYV